MKIIIGIYLALTFGALCAYTADFSGLLNNPALQQNIQSALLSNPQITAKIAAFLQQNGINVSQLAAGNFQSVMSADFLAKVKAFLLSNPDLIQLINSLGISLPITKDIDWGQVISVFQTAVPILITIFGKRDLNEQELIENFKIELARLDIDWNQVISVGQTVIQITVQVLPIITSLFGKRDLSLQQLVTPELLSSLMQLLAQSGLNFQTILSVVQAVQSGNYAALLSLLPANLLNQVNGLISQLANVNLSQLLASLLGKRSVFIPDHVIKPLISYLNLLPMSNSIVANKILRFLSANNIFLPNLVIDLSNGVYEKYLTQEAITKFKNFMLENSDVAVNLNQNFGDLIAMLP